MGKMATTFGDKLPAFQKYLLEKNLAPAKNVPFYAHWVSRFLDYARRNEFSALEYQESAILGFLDSLKSENHVLDWQHRQANDSIRLYYFHYLNKTDARSVKAVASDSMSDIIQETKRLIRLKHYSYSTKRTYLQWIERFLEYARQAAKKPSPKPTPPISKISLAILPSHSEFLPLRRTRHLTLFYLSSVMCWEKKSEISPIPSARNAGRNCPLSFRWKRSNDYWPA
jgi:hypothetical protein